MCITELALYLTGTLHILLTAVLQNMQSEFEAAIHLLLRHTQQKEKHPPPFLNLWVLQTCQNRCVEERKEDKNRDESGPNIRPSSSPGQRTQRSYSARRIGRFLGHGEHWHLSLCALYHPAIAGSIIVLTRTSCHWLPSAMSTYRRGLVVIRGSGLWLLWVIHNIHIQINRKAFAHGFVFALAFCSSQPSSVRVIAPVQSYKNTESDTRRNHQHGHAA